MKNYLLILLSLLIISCRNNTTSSRRIVFTGYKIPIQGGQIDIKIDSVSPLNELISKLKTETKLYETDKGYWIGYNDLMFSIAVHSDDALKSLLNFIDTTKSFEAKQAAIYTIHLIGINCTIVGRTYEDFINLKARDAMFSLLHKNDSIQKLVMLLLIRDPRESDIPRLFNILDSSKYDCWAISNGLLRYNLKNPPIAQKVPDNLANKSVRLKLSDSEHDNTNNQVLLRALTKKYGEFFIVEDTLFNYQFDHLIAFDYAIHDYSISEILFFGSLVGYSFIGNNFQYYFQNSKIYLVSPKTSKKLWLNWWNSQSKLYKDSLIGSEKRIKNMF